MAKTNDYTFTIGGDASAFLQTLTNCRSNFDKVSNELSTDTINIGLKVEDKNGATGTLIKIASLLDQIKENANNGKINQKQVENLSGLFNKLQMTGNTDDRLLTFWGQLSDFVKMATAEINKATGSVDIATPIVNQVTEAKSALKEANKAISDFKKDQKKSDVSNLVESAISDKVGYQTKVKELFDKYAGSTGKIHQNQQAELYKLLAVYKTVYNDESFDLTEVDTAKDVYGNGTFKTATKGIIKDAKEYITLQKNLKDAKKAQNATKPAEVVKEQPTAEAPAVQQAVQEGVQQVAKEIVQKGAEAAQNAVAAEPVQQVTEEVVQEAPAAKGKKKGKAAKKQENPAEPPQPAPAPVAPPPEPPEEPPKSPEVTPTVTAEEANKIADTLNTAVEGEKQAFDGLQESIGKVITAHGEFAKSNEEFTTNIEANIQKILGEKEALEQLSGAASKALSETKSAEVAAAKATDAEKPSKKAPKKESKKKATKKAPAPELVDELPIEPIKMSKKDYDDLNGIEKIKVSGEKTAEAKEAIEKAFANANYSNVAIKGLEDLDKNVKNLTVTAKDGAGVVRNFRYELEQIETDDGENKNLLVAKEDVGVKLAKQDLHKETEDLAKNTAALNANTEAAQKNEEVKSSKSPTTKELLALDRKANNARFESFKENGIFANEEIYTKLSEAREQLKVAVESGHIDGDEYNELLIVVHNIENAYNQAAEAVRTYNSEIGANNLKSFADYKRVDEKTDEILKPDLLPSYDKLYDESLQKITQLNEQAGTGQITLAKYNSSIEKINKEMDKAQTTYAKPTGYLRSLNDGETADSFLQGYLNDLSEKTRSSASAIKTKNGGNISYITYDVEKLNGTIEKTELAVNNVTGAVTQTVTSTRKGVTQIDNFFGSLKNKFKSMGTWMLSFGSMRMLWNEFKQGLTYVKEFDSAMAQLKFVTQADSQTIDVFKGNIQGVSNEVAETATALAQSTTDWARLGNSIDDSLTLARASAIYARTGFTDTETATSSLISTMKAFGYEAEDSMEIVDKFVNVGNKFAITAEQLGTGLTRSGAALHAAGNDLSESIALTTAANTVLQNAETASTTLRTVSMRLRGTKASELEELGEDTTGLIENASKVNSTIKELTKTASNPTGISILTDDGAYKSTYQILYEIAQVWKEIAETNGGDLKQAALLETIAGKVRATGVAAILENPEILKESYEEAENSMGTAEQAMTIAMDTIDAKLTQLSNSWQIFWQNTVNTDAVKTAVDGINSLVQVLDKLVNSVGLLPTLATGVAGIAGAKGVGRARMSARISIKPTPLLAWQHGTRGRPAPRRSGICRPWQPQVLTM